MKKARSQSESLDLTEEESSSETQDQVIIGASTDDVLAMLQTGILLDPRLRFDPNSAPKQFVVSPLPVFRGRVEGWFERDVEARETPGKPVGLVIESSGDRQRLNRSPLALPTTSVNEVIFRNLEERERFDDLLIQFELDGKLGRIRLSDDVEMFGADTEISRIEPVALSPDQLLYVQRVFRVTSAIAVSIAARRDKRSTEHAVRLLKGLVSKSPVHERDNDTPLFDGVLSHRKSISTLLKGSVEQLIVSWSNLILDDSFATPMSLSVLLDRLESALLANLSLGEFVNEAQLRFVEIRDTLDGRRAMSPFLIGPNTTSFTRVLDALQLMVMRRSPMDLLTMPRNDHMASAGVFMLAAYWSGISIPRIQLMPGVATEPLLGALVDLEVNAIHDEGPEIPIVAGKYKVEVDETPGRTQFKFRLNGEYVAAPLGSSWRTEVSPQPVEQLKPHETPSVIEHLDPSVVRYSLQTHDAEIRNGEIVITRRESLAPAKRSKLNSTERDR